MKYLTYYILILFLLVSSCTAPQPKPEIKKGYLDLSSWNFDKDGSLQLNGDWEFYWNKLYEPKDFHTENQPSITKYLEVPGYWSYQDSSIQIPPQGFATYRIKIKTATQKRMLALKMLDASSSYRIFVNGNLIASNGNTSTDIKLMRAEFIPMVRVFNNTADEIEIVMQISNNFHAKGGPWSPITLGTQEQILHDRDKNAVSDMFLIGAMFILFIYHIWIFIFRRSEKAVFWFGILCFAALARSLVTSERFLYVIFPSFDPGVAMRIEYFSICMAWLSWGCLLYYLFPKDVSKKIMVGINIVTIISTAVIFFTPHQFYTSKINWFQGIIIVLAFYYTYIAILSLKRKRHGGIAMALSVAVMFACVINDVLYSRLIINSAFIIPYGFFAALLSQAYLLASRISDAFKTVEALSINLEIKVEERTSQLKEEKKKSDDLLLNILPEEIAEELKENGSSKARNYASVTVLFTDFVNFTGISEQMTPDELVEEINRNFTAFDAIMEKHGLEKIKTIGDAYMSVCGLPNENNQHAKKVVEAAIDILQYMNSNNGKFKIRIGINSGSVVAGIVGVKKFAYDIWGDAVNTAARMEQNSAEGMINISQSTYELVKNDFSFTHRGKISAKNKGDIDMYFVALH